MLFLIKKNGFNIGTQNEVTMSSGFEYLLHMLETPICQKREQLEGG